MTFRRPLTAFALAGLLLAAAAAGPVRGQAGVPSVKEYALKPAVEYLPGDDLSKMADLRAGKLRTKGTAQSLAEYKQLFKRVADKYVYAASDGRFYAADAELKPRKNEESFDFVVMDPINGSLIVPDGVERVSLDQNDYLQELAAAYDAALRAVLAKEVGGKMPPAVMRVHYGRILAAVARTGAKAHARMIVDLLTDQFCKEGGKVVPTPPDLLDYALKAADAALAAYDPLAAGRAGLAHRHSWDEADVIKLVAALEGMVADTTRFARIAAPPQDRPTVPPPAAAATPAARLDPSGYTTEQKDVAVYFRRQAVKALSRVRQDEIGGTAGLPLVRPAYTLAQVAAAEKSFLPPVTNYEAGLAVVGLSGMTPGDRIDLDVWAYAVAFGARKVVAVKAADASDRSFPWKPLGARLAVNAAALRKATTNNPKLLGKKPVADLAAALADAAAGLERGTPVTTDKLDAWLAEHKPAKADLFGTAPPASKLTFAD